MRRKWILIAFVVLLTLGLLCYFGSGALLREGIERAGSAALGTPTSVAGASISFFSGRFGLSRLTVDNPEGFQADKALRVSTIQIDAGLLSLLTDTVRIEEILIESPEIAVEVGLGGTNLGKLIRQLEPTAKPEAPSGDAADGTAGKKLVIDRVRILTPKVFLGQTIAGSDQQEITLDSIELRDLGTSPDAKTTTLSRLLARIIGAVLAETAKRNDAIPPELVAILNQDLSLPSLAAVRNTLTGNVAETIKAGLDGKKLDEDTLKQELKESKDALKGLLKKKD